MALDVNQLFQTYLNDPSGPGAILAAAGIGNPVTGGTPAPTPSQAADPGQETPAQRFLANYQRYARSKPNARDAYGRPLLEAAARRGLHRRTTMGGAPVGDPIRLLTGQGKGLDAVVKGTDQDPFQEYDLGDGRIAHVRYDDRGRRSVKVFRR